LKFVEGCATITNPVTPICAMGTIVEGLRKKVEEVKIELKINCVSNSGR
jgi:hypothetical protein